jgi:hypothetical protein
MVCVSDEYDFVDDADFKAALDEANNLRPEQLAVFYAELEKMPTPKAPISGAQAVLCFQFMEDVGSRVNETIHVQKKHVNTRTGIVIITHPKSRKRCKCSRWGHVEGSRRMKLISADRNCEQCAGKGRWRAPQKATYTPRIAHRLHAYLETLDNDDCLFPVNRVTLWRWGKAAGKKAKINIFQEKEVRSIEGIFLHLFRALCALRMTADAQNDPYRDQMISRKLRHSVNTALINRYNRIDINYVISWERKTYGHLLTHT